MGLELEDSPEAQVYHSETVILGKLLAFSWSLFAHLEGKDNNSSCP